MKEILKRLYRKCIEYKLWFLFILPLLIILFYSGILIYMTYPISEYSISKAGQFGDSFGILNSLFSGLAFISLVITIKIQQKEIKDTKEEMFKQNFENTFFKLFEQYNNSLIMLKTHNEDIIDIIIYTQGRSFLNVLNDNNKGFLKSYFMLLYQILKFIDEQDRKFENKEFFNPKLYTNLIRTTLEDKLLLLLAINCTFTNFNKFKELVEKYSFLEHFEPHSAIFLQIGSTKIYDTLYKFDTKVFGENEEIMKQNISKMLNPS